MIVSNRILKLNRTNDDSINNWVGEGVSAGDNADDTFSTVRFHPMVEERLSESIQKKRQALVEAAKDAVPAVLDAIERLQKNPEGIDGDVASQIGDMLHHALTAMKTSVDLKGAADRDDYNRLKTEMQDLQTRLLDALDQVQSTRG